ncbi:MAG: glycosyltransferase [Desulfovibrionaceae bacterium]|nr:glycosyltransferase [Desulfovibrionaceae bacterium]
MHIEPDTSGMSPAFPAAGRQGKERLPASVCLYIDTLGAGGAERQVVTLARELQSRGIAVRVLCDRLDGEHGHYLPNLAQAGIEAETFISEEHFQLGLVLAERNPPLLKALAGFSLNHHTVLCLAGRLRRARPDILHCFLDGSNAIGGCAGLAAAVPGVILSARNTIPGNLAYDGYRELATITLPIYTFLLTHPNVLLEANSSAGARDYAGWVGVAPESFAVNPNGLDTTLFAPQEASSRLKIRRELDIAEDAPLIFWIGKNYVVKRPSDMLAIAASVHEKMPSARFAVAGNGMGTRDPIAESVCKCGLDGVVKLLGRRKDIPALFNAADAFLLTSEVEGFPNAVMEAMYMGLPVVATAVGAVPDIMEPGKQGFLHPVGDVQGMADSLLHLLGNPTLAKALGEAGKKRIEERFTSKNLRENALTMYEGLLGRIQGGSCS